MKTNPRSQKRAEVARTTENSNSARCGPDQVEQEFAETLRQAAYIFEKEENGRFQGSILACRAVARFIHQRDGGAELAGPFLQIAAAFEERERGGNPRLFSKKSAPEKERERSPERKLMFAVSLAFTGPILRFVRGPRGGGFQLWGDQETGKTTATMVAGSVWGCNTGTGDREIGFAETWHSTANKVEITALAHNDCLLILDETTLAGSDDRSRAQVVITVTMTLAQQREKQRMTNVGSARSWRCYFFSTSNLTLDALADRGKVVLHDALRSRLTEIPLPTGGNGIYEELHGFASGKT
jgi:hypothetical protein